LNEEEHIRGSIIEGIDAKIDKMNSEDLKLIMREMISAKRKNTE